ncbi:hypothetical protein AB0M12_41825 [Nocardia vinacea]|uniref:hypothetical protein n=1 Tax=Nocardia vinacea TaxID=96468 RepID=UPI00341ED91D
MPSVDLWYRGIESRIRFVREFYGGCAGDFTGLSLVEFEDFVLGHFDTPAELEHPGQALVIQGCVAYLGETLLRLAGGAWQEGADPEGLPLVGADPVLGLAPAAPAELVEKTVRTRREGLLSAVFADWERATQAYERDHPSWTPQRRPTPGLDPIPPAAADVAYLRSWLDEQEQAFPAWAAGPGAGTTWDFSRQSLDALGALVLQLTPTLDALLDPANARFTDVAAWYLGESIRRIKGGEWGYRDGNPKTDPLAYPHISQAEPNGHGKVIPIFDLQLTVRRGDPHNLTNCYDDFIP